MQQAPKLINPTLNYYFFLADFALIRLHTQICMWLSQVRQDYQTHHVNVMTENSFEEISVVITHGHIYRVGEIASPGLAGRHNSPDDL